MDSIHTSIGRPPTHEELQVDLALRPANAMFQTPLGEGCVLCLKMESKAVHHGPAQVRDDALPPNN